MTGWKRAAITAVVAYALALQALFLSFSGAVHAGSVAGPQGILCAWDATPAPDHSPAKAHDGLCCILGCGVSSAAAGPVPSAIVLDRLVPVATLVGFSFETPLLRVASKVLPVGSRAPPRLG
ncbi:hypothetical protein [Microvirga terricola]|uniref:DUF2946 domain-containing protein n=1 Tax=Microvirga terricola TaxID=2719797 RepID=A0ABX0V8X8_9HYPH|nr:hypothetical protein [Microvirga terricola]NIX75500.1 hypothetical protein [Microvirga terricola]